MELKPTRTIACPGCQQPIGENSPSAFSTGVRVFCSKACHDTWAKLLLGKNRPKIKYNGYEYDDTELPDSYYEQNQPELAEQEVQPAGSMPQWQREFQEDLRKLLRRK